MYKLEHAAKGVNNILSNQCGMLGLVETWITELHGAVLCIFLSPVTSVVLESAATNLCGNGIHL